MILGGQDVATLHARWAEEVAGRPILYLDIDDTIVRWRDDRPEPAEGAAEFLLWALEHYDVRWLTTWAPNGEIPPDLLVDLAKMVDVPIERLALIRGLSWEGGSKLDGIAWLEHVVHGRPFVWLEDDNLPEAVTRFLERHGYHDSYRLCNVSREPDILRRRHAELRRGEARRG